MISAPSKKISKVKMSKLNKRKKLKQKVIKVDDWRDKYSMYRGRELPESSIRALAENVMRIAAEDPSTLTFNGILARCSVQDRSFSRFADKYKILKEAKNYAMFRIGVNREEAALRKEIDVQTMKHMQGRYDPEWRQRELELLEDKLKVTAAYNKAPSFVVIPSVSEFKKEIKDSKENVSGETNISS